MVILWNLKGLFRKKILENNTIKFEYHSNEINQEKLLVGRYFKSCQDYWRHSNRENIPAVWTLVCVPATTSIVHKALAWSNIIIAWCCERQKSNDKIVLTCLRVNIRTTDYFKQTTPLLKHQHFITWTNKHVFQMVTLFVTLGFTWETPVHAKLSVKPLLKHPHKSRPRVTV